MKPILVLGNITCDIIVQIDEMPKIEEDLAIHKQEMQLGGCAFNIASMLHLHQCPYTLISPVGEGMYGDFIQRELSKKDFPPLLKVKGEHGCCYCLVDALGERTFMAYHGVEYTFKQAWLQPYKRTEFSYVYVCGLDIDEVGGNDIIHFLEGVKCPIFFAPGPSVLKISADKMSRLQKLKPILHVNEKEAKELSKQAQVESALEYLYKQWQSIVIVTLGAQGSCAMDETGTYYAEGVLSKVVDTIGAGDAHAACMLYSLVQGNTLQQGLSYANKVSSEVVQQQGASLSLTQFSKIR